MSSNINPNNIDGTYPIAGQDNNSQGFRDNFTQTKVNFQYAADEITALQDNAILKAPLTQGGTVTNNMGGTLLYDATMQDFAATRVDLGSVSGTCTINYASGHYQTVTISSGITLAFTNFPAATASISSRQGWVTVAVTATAGNSMTLPAAVGSGASAASIQGIQGISGQVITFKESGTYEFEFHTFDGGSTIYLSELTRPRNRWMNPLFVASSEDLADAAAVSLTTFNSYFSTNAGETTTLAAGVEGQIKVFNAVNVTSGNMIITVTNAGWQASGTGTITFPTRGSSAILQYVNSKWFCIGNNGATFA
jgi:hypothetical protein